MKQHRITLSAVDIERLYNFLPTSITALETVRDIHYRDGSLEAAQWAEADRQVLVRLRMRCSNVLRDVVQEELAQRRRDAPHPYRAEKAGWRTCSLCGQGANASIHRAPQRSAPS